MDALDSVKPLDYTNIYAYLLISVLGITVIETQSVVGCRGKRSKSNAADDGEGQCPGTIHCR